jgi:hypothetical protein
MQAAYEREDDCVASMVPKFKPVTVTSGPPPLRTRLSATYEDTGASKENPSLAVPATAPTVTTKAWSTASGFPDNACTVVDDVQDAVIADHPVRAVVPE